jgi:RNA 3'-terminal phosphate cyclase (ATP)
MITIDGAAGEGGGQILRSALSLSMVTGQPFRIDQIRADRPKPGLLRQHLASVRAAATICDAEIVGAELGSRSLTFTPGPVKGGDFRFAINSAGSTVLVLQTLLPALACAGVEAQVTVQGGTHNPHAPPFEFFEQAFLPLVRRIGWEVSATLNRTGFYPAGGGEIVATIQPSGTFQPLVLEERGALIGHQAEAIVANLPIGIAEREIAAFGVAIGWPADCLTARAELSADGPGNVMVATARFEHVTEVFCEFGMPRVSAEAVGQSVASSMAAYMTTHVPVGAYLADQLLVPMALGAGGRFCTGEPSEHLRTNAEIVEKFLEQTIRVGERNIETWLIEVGACRSGSLSGGATP